MSAVRRAAVLLALTLAVIVGASLPAAATYKATEALPTTTVGTVTVQPATNVRVDTECTTTTTVIRETYRKNPYTGTTTRTGYSESSTTRRSTSNVERDSTTTTWASSVEYTTTRTIEDTELAATGRWKASTSPGVTGYRLTAILDNGWAYPVVDAGPTATSETRHYDGEVVDLGARLEIVTLTRYGWTARSELSTVVRC